MELILWRHADAEDGKPDLERKLTPKGEKQAKRVAKWLIEHLPEQFSVVASPALRAQQTAAALGVQVKTIEALAPGASVDQILAAARNKKAVVIVGHQPDLGRAVAHLVAGARSEWHIEKGGFWWLSGEAPVVVKAVLSPDLL
ncbi:MAG TPA: phosphohistidine phosphatase SixA [Burkholderiales bacterium]|nr:phosphohistidine phosphatase SixA [Burkholderiales bacterium]